MNKTHQIPKQYTRALIDNNSINVEKRQFDVVFATETPVFRRGWDENFNEVLICNTSNMRTQRMDNGVVPLLDNHDKFSGVTKQYGALVSYKVENGECRGTIQFSGRADLQGIWDDIQSGIIKGISAGYMPWVYQREVVAGQDVPNYRAIDWEVLEISLAPVPADLNSKIRNNNENDLHEIQIQNFNTRKMNETQPEVIQTKTPQVNAEERAAPTPAPVILVDEAKIRSEAAQVERQRGLDIRFAVRAAQLDETFAEQLINSGTNIEQARAQIIDKMAANDKTPTPKTTVAPANVSVNGDEREQVRNAMSEALMHRAAPGSVKLDVKSQDFKYMSMLDMCRHALTMNGEKAFNYSPSEVVKRAISTTDFPDLLNSTLQRTIRRFYDQVPQEWKKIANQTTAKDFRTKTGLAIDGQVTFDEIPQGGEYRQGQLITDEKLTVKLKTYGKEIVVSRQAIINDDLGVFDRLPRMIAVGAANFQAQKIWALITANANAQDGAPIFGAGHKNLAAAGGGIDVAGLTAARTALWRQKSPGGNPYPVPGKYLVVPMELMTSAEQLVTNITANQPSAVNPFSGKYELITSPYLTSAKEWYLMGDPALFEGLVYAYLEGEEGLYVEKEIDFDTDGVKTKARLDFDCAIWDYKAWYKNPGV